MEEKNENEKKAGKSLVAPIDFDFMADFFDPFRLARRSARLLQNFSDRGTLLPNVDMVDNGDSFTVLVDMPGVDKKDIKLKVSEDMLELSAERNEEKEKRGGNYYAKERSSSGYYRTIRFPEQVKADSAKAKMNNGTLSVEVKKVKESRGKEVKID